MWKVSFSDIYVFYFYKSTGPKLPILEDQNVQFWGLSLFIIWICFWLLGHACHTTPEKTCSGPKLCEIRIRVSMYASLWWMISLQVIVLLPFLSYVLRTDNKLSFNLTSQTQRMWTICLFLSVITEEVKYNVMGQKWDVCWPKWGSVCIVGIPTRDNYRRTAGGERM